jgi:HK97 family phage major capsid protein
LKRASRQSTRKGAVWMMNKATLGEVRKLKDGAGRFV